MRQIVIDTETTGLRPEQVHRVVEIGCVELVNRRLTGEKYHVYLNPEREMEHEAQEVHGLTNEFLADKPVFKDIAQAFIDFIKDAELIAHNAPFDVGFINHEFKLARLGLGKLSKYCHVIDTLKLARQTHPGQSNSLDALSKRYHIEHFNRALHGSLLDAEILAHVYLAMTGGQTTLFGEQSQSVYTSHQVETVQEKEHTALSIIDASELKLAEHLKILEMLQKESGGEMDW